MGGSIEAGYDIAAGNLTLRPQAGFTQLEWRRAAFAETGGPAPLSVAKAAAEQGRLWAGLTAAWAMRRERHALSVEAYGRAVSVSGDRVARVTTFDPQLPDVPFIVTGPSHGGAIAEYGVALGIGVGANARLSAGYEGRSSATFESHTAEVTLRIAL
jgi:outer membrane autotransporter protein